MCHVPGSLSLVGSCLGWWVAWGAGRLEGARCAVWAVLGRGGGQVGLVRGEAG